MSRLSPNSSTVHEPSSSRARGLPPGRRGRHAAFAPVAVLPATVPVAPRSSPRGPAQPQHLHGSPAPRSPPRSPPSAPAGSRRSAQPPATVFPRVQPESRAAAEPPHVVAPQGLLRDDPCCKRRAHGRAAGQHPQAVCLVSHSSPYRRLWASRV
eukprot:3023185-Prymnesium_polylepis.2